ncbi:MAG: hypothetical protein FWE83_01720 [Oscillospiraceae bacterium]|nr:hypothetical protein [Oscillospiraceae bacterium]
MPKEKEEKKDNKWEFEDYAFTFTGILVGVLLILPEILYSQFDISILGGSLSGVASELYEDLESYSGSYNWSIPRLRALSPLLFLLTTTIVLFYDAYEARKNGSFKGSMFTYTFESTLEDAIYMAIMTVLLYSTVLTNTMYASWLTGPIAWVLFVFIFPLVKKESRDDEFKMPWFLLTILLAGFIIELIAGGWIAFPLSWLIVCVFKFSNTIRAKITSLDEVFDALYYAFSIVLMAVGVGLGYWITSWTAFPIALLICWILGKLKIFKKAEE